MGPAVSPNQKTSWQAHFARLRIAGKPLGRSFQSCGAAGLGTDWVARIELLTYNAGN